MKTRYQTVIFDLDGTVFDDYRTIADSLNYALRRTGYKPQTLARVRRAVGRGPGTLFKYFVPEKDVKAVEEIYMKRYRQILCSRVKFLPGAYRLLKDLHQAGVKLAVASNKAGEFTRPILKHLKIDKYFRRVVCGDDVKRPKPHPEILLSIMKEFKSPASRTLYVGDMDIDARTGRAAGVRTVIVVTGSSLRKEVERERPYKILRRIGEVRHLVFNGKE